MAVITGGASGIGKQIACDLLCAGLQVVCLDKDINTLNEFICKAPKSFSKKLFGVECDVTKPASVDCDFKWTEENMCSVDILVNCAGLYSSGQLVTHKVDSIEGILAVNVMGVINCTRRAFKSMQDRNFAGHIVNINSVYGHHSPVLPPGVLNPFNIYPATKHAITAITESFRQEFSGLKTKVKITVSSSFEFYMDELLTDFWNVHLQSVSPSLVDTPMLPPEYKDFPKLNPEDISACVLSVYDCHQTACASA